LAPTLGVESWHPCPKRTEVVFFFFFKNKFHLHFYKKNSNPLWEERLRLSSAFHTCLAKLKPNHFFILKKQLEVFLAKIELSFP
jgi:hypothetical protein